jgi:hypothetical protein
VYIDKKSNKQQHLEKMAEEIFSSKAKKLTEKVQGYLVTLAAAWLAAGLSDKHINLLCSDTHLLLLLLRSHKPIIYGKTKTR